EPPPFAFLPFGGGARRCIGDEFALREAEIVAGVIARRYRLVKEPNVDVATAPLVTLRPAGPVQMRAVVRHPEQRGLVTLDSNVAISGSSPP
ncbi:MAG: cytochrome P450, partial [Candidatus Eremiobacteraeota bacterium]|nr:cytochrome P450 [Candidatus Eremiobacteraeota bacterium]